MSAGFLGALLRRADSEPDRVLFTLYQGGVAFDLTQAALVAGARPWARLFRNHGARPGAVVLIALPLGADLLQAFIGALFSGCIPSFMPCPNAKQDPKLFWSSHDTLFTRLGGGVIATTAANAADIAINIKGAPMIVVTPEVLAAQTDAGKGNGPISDGTIHAWGPDDTACLQHSSGTTGLKKGVALRFDQIEAQLDSYAHVLAIAPNDTIVSWLPLYHDMGFVACFLLPLARGNRTVLLDPFAWLVDPLVLFDLVAHHRGAFVWLPNFAFNHLVNAAFDDERRVDLGSLRAIIDCSERCESRSLAAFEARFRGWGLRTGCLLTCYAMAETVFAVTQSAIGESPPVLALDRARLEAGVTHEPASAIGAVEVVSAGRPLPGVTIAVLDEGLQPVAADRLGQIAIRAPFLFAGYHLDPERSARAFHAGFYLTGDLGFMRGDQLFVLGRSDDLLNLLGRNVFANEIEFVLGAVVGLKPGRVLALGLHDEAIGSQALIVVAEREGVDEDHALVRAEIRVRLDSILAVVPRHILFVEPGWLVKSTSGKISRNENRSKYLAYRDGLNRFDAA